jgi:hypothetical protein
MFTHYGEHQGRREEYCESRKIEFPDHTRSNSSRTCIDLTQSRCPSVRSGVDFAPGASPPNLPGGNAPAFSFDANFSADSTPPAQPNGVNPGEFLSMIFT